MKLALIGFGNVGRALARLLRQKSPAFPFTITGIHTLRHGTAVNPAGLSADPAFGPHLPSIEAFLDPAGVEKAKGIIANARSKGWRGPQARKDPAVRAFLDWMTKYNPKASLRDFENVYGYEVAQTLVEVLKKCGDNLTRENVMKQATSLDLELGMLRPGIRITTSPTDYQPIKQLFLVQFDGESWNPLDKH